MRQRRGRPRPVFAPVAVPGPALRGDPVEGVGRAFSGITAVWRAARGAGLGRLDLSRDAGQRDAIWPLGYLQILMQVLSAYGRSLRVICYRVRR